MGDALEPDVVKPKRRLDALLSMMSGDSHKTRGV